MMKILQLINIISNGITFAAYEIEGRAYRADLIQQRQQVMIPSLPKNKVTRVDLLGTLKFNLLVTGIDIDLTEDDDRQLEENSNSNNKSPTFNLYVSVINRKTEKVIKKLAFYLNSYPNYTNEIILNPDFIYDIKADRDIKMLTFTGEPVFMRDNIVFTDGIEKENEGR